LVERPGEHALSGCLTLFRRGWCHTPFLLFNRSFHGVLAVQIQPFKWAAKVANPVAHGECKIHGIRRSAIARFCASLRHLSGPVKLRLGEMPVLILAGFLCVKTGVMTCRHRPHQNRPGQGGLIGKG
jgi:hypothetical protein